MDYTKICFVVMPFGSKPVGKHKVNFDNIYENIFKPAINAVALAEGGKLKAARTDKDFFAGDIGREISNCEGRVAGQARGGWLR